MLFPHAACRTSPNTFTQPKPIKKPPVLFGEQSEPESLIRRTAFHMGEHPWTGAPLDEATTSQRFLDKNVAEGKPPKGLEALLKPTSRTFQFIGNALKPLVYYREKPTLVVAGGTIDTAQDASTGTRLPDLRTQAQRIEATKVKTHAQLYPFPKLAVDSSNITRELQQEIMKQINVQVLENLKSLHSDTLHRFTDAPEKTDISGVPYRFMHAPEKTDKKEIPLDELPQYFNTPCKWGRGVYITHGTDTLAHNAAVAAYMFRDAHLVSVWTGAWNSQTEKGFDGTLNEERARLLAKHPYMPPGAYIVIGNKIHLAAKAQKINNHPFQPKTRVPYTPESDGVVSYFASMDDQPVGYFDQANKPHISTHFLRQEEKRAEQKNLSESPAKLLQRYSQPDVLKPAHVETLVINMETPYKAFSDLCRRLEKKGAYTGAIIEGNAAQRSDWPKMNHEIDTLRKKNIFILPTGKNLTPHQAQIKLSALLSEKNAHILETMQEDLLGEALPPEVVHRERLLFPPAFFENHEWLHASPALQPEAIQDAARRLLEKKVPQPSIVIHGTGDGHIPIGALSMEQRIIQGYQQLKQPEALNRLQTEMTRQKLVYNLPNVLKALTTLRGQQPSHTVDPQHTAQDELKRVLRHSDPMLMAIGEAQDQGIQVRMGTQVPFAEPNLSSYEIGGILQTLGVKPFPEKFNAFTRGVGINSAGGWA